MLSFNGAAQRLHGSAPADNPDSYTGRFLAELIEPAEPAPKPRRTTRRTQPVAA